MYRLQIPWNTIAKLGKYLLALIILAGIGYVGYMTYYFATNLPQEIRVTNITGSSATVSWYTNRPDMGMVAIKDKNSFLPVLAGWGARKGYDDRDYALALSTLADKATKKAEKDVDASLEVTLDSEALNSVKVTKKGMYYVHHVTVDNLVQEKDYYFRVGNGIFWWNVKKELQTYTKDLEAPTVDTLTFKTFKEPEEILAPNPAYGRILSLAKNKDGYLVQNASTDSIVFLYGYPKGNSLPSQYTSSITNTSGGWTIDKSNFRKQDGNLYTKDFANNVSRLYAYAQFQNIEPTKIVEMVYGLSDSPALDIVAGDDQNAKVQGSVLDKVLVSLGEVKVRNILSKISSSAYACSSGEVYSTWTRSCVADPNRTGNTSINAPTTPLKTPLPNNPPQNNTGTRDEGGNNNDGSNQCTTLKCSTGYTKRGCGCIYDTIAATLPSTSTDSKSCVVNFHWVEGRGCVSNLETPDVAPSTSNNNVDLNCAPGVQTITLSNGVTICDGTAAKNGRENGETCTGQHTKGCEINDGCFCQWSGDAGYSRLPGKSCRPLECSSPASGDEYSSGGQDIVRKYSLDGGKTYSLCGTMTSLPTGAVGDCALKGDMKTTRSGNIICNVGLVLNQAGNGCVKDPNYVAPATPGNGGSGSEQGNSDPDTGSKVKICTYIDITTGKQVSKTIAVNVDCSTLYPKDTLAANTDTCTNLGQRPMGGSHGGCVCDEAAGYSLVDAKTGTCEKKSDPVAVEASGACKSRRSDNNYNCGTTYSQGTKNCSATPNASNDGCGNGFICDKDGGSSSGYCLPVGGNIGVEFDGRVVGGDGIVADGEEALKALEENSSLKSGLRSDCYAAIDDKGKVSKLVVKSTTEFFSTRPDQEAGAGNRWINVDMKTCMKTQTGSYVPHIKSIVSDVQAASEVKTETQGNYLVIFPESGTYDIQIGSEKFKNIYVNKDNRHFFYVEKNGVDGYQLPVDGTTPTAKDDVLLPAEGAVVTLYEKAKNQTLKLDSGINIVSFNYLPSRVEGKNMNARQLMRILNSSGVKVSRITTFEGGKWLGGIAYDSTSQEIVGTDFAVVPGRGYLIVSNTSYNATVPGYGIKNSIPVALSSGWNLIGVNGFKKTFTASTMIDSVNLLNGLKANNVTWWPTSKGRYETFQKSEGIEYGFDFPILKDVGYFLRVSEFNVDDPNTKSIIWNPGGKLHGEEGSGKTK